MSSLIGTVPMDGGGGNVNHLTGVVPAGAAVDSTALVACWVTNIGLRNWTVTSSNATAPTVTKLDDQNVGSTGEMALFKITGAHPGDTLTFTWDGSTGKAGGRQVWHDNTIQLDLVSAIAATGTAATENVSGVVASEALEYCGTLAAGCGSAARTVTGITGATSRATGTSGGTNRFWADVYADEVLANSGDSSGVSAITFSGTLLGFGGWQFSLKAAGAPPPPPPGTALKVRQAGALVTATNKVRQAGALVTATTKVRQAGSLV